MRMKGRRVLGSRKGGMESLEQRVVFAGEDGARVEEQLVAVDAGDHGGGSLAQAGAEGFYISWGSGGY